MYKRNIPCNTCMCFRKSMGTNFSSSLFFVIIIETQSPSKFSCKGGKDLDELAVRLFHAVLSPNSCLYRNRKLKHK